MIGENNKGIVMTTKNAHLISSVLLLFVLMGRLYAQNISGKVNDENNLPLFGANIIVEGTGVGAATNENGEFSFTVNAADNFTLVISYIGYHTQRESFYPNDKITGLLFSLKQKNLFGNEITVLARKREESIKDVPISMVAVRGETIEEMGATSIEDLTAMVPNVYATERQSNTEFNIRGISGGSRNPGMSTAEGIYIDGVIMGDPNFIVADVIEMERVEFLRGPQGTLFGRNTVSGAINLITVKPTPINRASIFIETGQMGYQKLKGSANYKISDKIYSRVSGYSFNYDGYLKNAFNNKTEKYKNNLGGRVAIRALPTPKLTIDLSMDFFNEDLTKIGGHISDYRISSSSTNFDNKRLDSLYYNLKSIDITDDGKYSYNHDTTSISNKEIYSATLNTNYRLNENLQLISVFSIRNAKVNWFNDEDGTALDILTGDWLNTGKQYTGEFRLMSNQNDKISWIGGVYYYNLYNFLSGPVYPKPLFFYYAAGIPMFIAKNYTDLVVKPEGSGNTTSMGVYGSIDFQLLQKLFLTVGIRYSNDKMDFKYKQKGIQTFGYINVPSELDSDGNPIGYFDSTKTWHATTPSMNIKYAISDGLNIYGTLSKGYKSGGFNMDYVSSMKALSEPFKPEYITNYELGFKYGNYSNTLYLNAALFKMEYKNMQVSQFQDLFEGYLISNAASATITGLELEVSARLFDNALTLVGGYGIVEAVYNDFHDGYFNGYWNEGESYTDSNGNGNYDTGEDFTDLDNDFSGNHISTYPKQSWSLMADFRLPINSKKMFVSQLRSDYIGEKLSQLTTDKDANLLRDDARTLVNGHFGIEQESWGLYVWGENLLNKEYIISQGTNGYLGFVEQLWGQPRLLGIRFSYKM